MHHHWTSIAILVGLSAGSASAQPCSPTEMAKLLAGDGAADDHFGSSVSVSGEIAAIGAYGDDDNGTDSGSVFIYRFDGTNWVQETKLLPDDGSAFDNFGISVAVTSDIAVVGAVGNNDYGPFTGSAYIFRYDGTIWIQEAKLLPDNGIWLGNFGISVSVAGDTVLIAASMDDGPTSNTGAGYIFRYDGAGWIRETKLLPTHSNGTRHPVQSVSISGDTAVLGMPTDNDTAPLAGSAYVFRFDGTNWVQEAKLLAADGSQGDNFGISVSVSGDAAIIGALVDDTGDYTNEGAAYVFRFDGTNWTEEAKLVPADREPGDQFGRSVSISGDTAVIGAFFDSHDEQFTGSAYVYEFDGAGWKEKAKLLSGDREWNDRFGNAVAVSGTRAIIGVTNDDDRGTDSGSASVFELKCVTECLPDVNNDGKLDPTDFDAWIAAFNDGTPGRDQNGDGTCTPHDFTAWIANYNAGC